MTTSASLAAGDDAGAIPHQRRRSDSGTPGPRHKRPAPSPPPRRAIRPLLLLVALVNLAWSLYQLPVSRVVESRLCRAHYAAHEPAALRPDGSVPEALCKIDAVQQRLGRIQGGMETLWVAGDFLMTIPLVSLADHYGHHLVLCLNLVPRVFLLGWTFAVGYFDQVLPVNAIFAAPVFSFLGGDCVFNSIVYALVSELTDDHVLRATFFGYVNAVSSIFSLQLGPALASATMTILLWLPLWLGIALLLLAVPVITSLPPSATTPTRKFRSLQDEENDSATPLIPASSQQPQPNLKSLTTARFRALLSLLKTPARDLVLLLSVFFLASLASSDTKLLPLYVSKRYGWTFAAVGYLLSVKAVFNFVLLSVVVPRVLGWRRGRARLRSRSGLRSRSRSSSRSRSASGAATGLGPGVDDRDTTKENVGNAYICLVLSVLGALAIALSPTVAVLLPALLLYALGIALPMFTYSLLRAGCMGLHGTHAHRDENGAGPGTQQLFSVVMLVRTVGTLVGAVLMPSLWVAGVGVGGLALGLPFAVSAVCYAVAGGLVRRIGG